MVSVLQHIKVKYWKTSGYNVKIKAGAVSTSSGYASTRQLSMTS